MTGSCPQNKNLVAKVQELADRDNILFSKIKVQTFITCINRIATSSRKKNGLHTGACGRVLGAALRLFQSILASNHASVLPILQNKKLVGKVKELADKKGCTLGQLALSWVHHQGEDVFPIPGTKRVKYLEENIAAFNVKLSKEELAEIDQIVPHDAVSCCGAYVKLPLSPALWHSPKLLFLGTLNIGDEEIQLLVAV